VIKIRKLHNVYCDQSRLGSTSYWCRGPRGPPKSIPSCIKPHEVSNLITPCLPVNETELRHRKCRIPARCSPAETHFVRIDFQSPTISMSAAENDEISSTVHLSGQHTQSFDSTFLNRVHLPVSSHPAFGRRDDERAHLGHEIDISKLPHFTSAEHRAAGIDITRDNPIEGIAYSSGPGWSFAPPKSKGQMWAWYNTKVTTDMPWTYIVEENHPAMRAALMLLRGDDGSGTFDAIIRGAEMVVRDAQDGMELGTIGAAINDILARRDEDTGTRRFVGGTSGRGVHLGASAEERLRPRTLGLGEEARRMENSASNSPTVKARKRRKRRGQNHQYPDSRYLRVVDRGEMKEGQATGSAGEEVGMAGH
jgi:hypothetical protein